MTRPAPPGGAQTPWRIFRSPLALAAVSGLGLVAALLTEGPVDYLWDLMVAAPLVVIAVKLARRRPRH